MKAKTIKSELTEIKENIKTLQALILEDLKKNRDNFSIAKCDELIDEYLNGAKNNG